MGTCVVVVEQQATGDNVWTACAPILENFGLVGVEVPLGIDHLSLWEPDRGRMTGFGEEDHDHLLRSAPQS